MHLFTHNVATNKEVIQLMLKRRISDCQISGSSTYCKGASHNMAQRKMISDCQDPPDIGLESRLSGSSGHCKGLKVSEMYVCHNGITLEKSSPSKTIVLKVVIMLVMPFIMKTKRSQQFWMKTS